MGSIYVKDVVRFKTCTPHTAMATVTLPLEDIACVKIYSEHKDEAVVFTKSGHSFPTSYSAATKIAELIAPSAHSVFHDIG